MKRARRSHDIPGGAFEVPCRDSAPLRFDVGASTRRAHFRRLLDLVLLSIQRGDHARARRGWGIIARCWEARSFWDCEIALEIVEGDGQRSKKRRNIVHGETDALRERITDKVVMLREQTMGRIDRGQCQDALDLLELSLTSQPYRSDATLNLYAGLCILFLSQADSRASIALDTVDAARPRKSIGTDTQRRAWLERANTGRLKEARAYFEHALDLLGGIPDSPSSAQDEVKQLTRDISDVPWSKSRTMQIIKDWQAWSVSKADADLCLRCTVLQYYTLTLENGDNAGIHDEDEEPLHEQPRGLQKAKAVVATRASSFTSEEDGANDDRPLGFSIFSRADSSDGSDS